MRQEGGRGTTSRRSTGTYYRTNRRYIGKRLFSVLTEQQSIPRSGPPWRRKALFLLSLKAWSTSRETASIYVIRIIVTSMVIAFSYVGFPQWVSVLKWWQSFLISTGPHLCIRQLEYLEHFHGKSVVLDADHHHSPFPAPFLIQEMRTRGFHPWCTDRPIPHPRSTTYTPDNNSEDVGGLGGGSDTGVGLGGSCGMGTPGGSGGVASSSSEPPSTGINQQYLVLGNPFQDPKLLESMRRQWQQLPNWKSATVEGLTWEGTAGENTRKYANLVGVSTY